MDNEEKTPIEGKIDDSYLVVKSNELVEKSYKLTAREQKIILLLASNIKINDKNFRKVKFKVSDIAQRLGIESKSVYDEMQVLTRSLIAKVIEITFDEDGKKKKTLQMTWLSSALYKHGDGVVELEFSEHLMPYLLEIKKHFTAYKIGNIVQLNSSYSIRIYELLKQYETVGEREFSIKDLKYYLGIEITQYKQYGHFKERVILSAQKELAQKTDIRFDFEEKKLEGRSVSHVRFIIYKNFPKTDSQQQLSLFDAPTNTENQELENELLGYGITKKRTKELVKSCPETDIRANIAYVLNKHEKGEVKNLGAFMFEAITENYAKKPSFVEEVEKQKQAEAEERQQKEIVKAEELKRIEALKSDYENYKDTFLSELQDAQVEVFKTTWLEKIVPNHVVLNSVVQKFEEVDFNNPAIKGPFRRWLFEQLKANGFLSFEDWANKNHSVKIKQVGNEFSFIS